MITLSTAEIYRERTNECFRVAENIGRFLDQGCVASVRLQLQIAQDLETTTPITRPYYVSAPQLAASLSVQGFGWPPARGDVTEPDPRHCRRSVQGCLFIRQASFDGRDREGLPQQSASLAFCRRHGV
jgi:hypothetical protein